MAIPAIAWGFGVAVLGGLAWLIANEEDDKEEELTAPDIVFTPSTMPASPTLPAPTPATPVFPPSVPAAPSGGAWNESLWGPGDDLNWAAIRSAMLMWGWPDSGVGGVTSDLNGASCPGVGVASRAGCNVNQQLKNYQYGFNRMIDRANNPADAFNGKSLFQGRAKLTTDGILGAKTLASFGPSFQWQIDVGGGPFGAGALREASIE